MSTIIKIFKNESAERRHTPGAGVRWATNELISNNFSILFKTIICLKRILVFKAVQFFLAAKRKFKTLCGYERMFLSVLLVIKQAARQFHVVMVY